MLVAFLGLSLSTIAQDMIVSATSATKSWNITEVRSFRFVDGKMIVKLKNGEDTEEINLSEISTIKFGNSTTAITHVKGENENVRFTLNGQHIVVEGLKQSVSMVIYAVSGSQVLRQNAWNGGSIDISNLPKGIYIIKLDNKNFKFRK
jgi:hypothetical protein